jgi:tryptophan synthase alpha subunit
MKKEYSKPVVAAYTGTPQIVPVTLAGAATAAAAAVAAAAGVTVGTKVVNAMFEASIVAHPSRKLEPVY